VQVVAVGQGVDAPLLFNYTQIGGVTDRFTSFCSTVPAFNFSAKNFAALWVCVVSPQV
jgi:hypothetical protein